MGIEYFSSPNREFTDLYIALRKKEQRFYSEAELRRLPEISKTHPHYNEWQCRKKSGARFLAYLNDKRRPLRILEIGSGNGWFSHMMSTILHATVLGIDVNVVELEQADAAFKKPNLSFAYADLFEDSDLYNRKFDLIVFNSCLQYFDNLTVLFDKIRLLLSETGEIHIIDSPFYLKDEVETAVQRTNDYYERLDFPEMAQHYFHHEYDSLGKYEIRYKPSFLTKLFKNDSPFCWIKINAS